MAVKTKAIRTGQYEWRSVCLTLAGKNLDPEKVTKALGIPPDDRAKRGEPRSTNRKKKCKQGYWSLDGGSSKWRVETQMTNILKRLSPVKRRLRLLLKEDKDVKRADLTIAIMPPAGVLAAQYRLNAELVDEFASLGVDIKLSIHVLGEVDDLFGGNKAD